MSPCLTMSELLERTGSLISPPKTYLALKKAIASPSSDYGDLSTLISNDPVIAVRLLKVANSAMFSFAGRINTIDRALSLIGTNQLSQLVLATEVLDAFKHINCEVVSLDQFWQHSIGCAVSARVLAQYKHEHDIEVFFLMGLLQGLGRLLLFCHCPETQQALLDAHAHQNSTLYLLEAEQYGFTQDSLGAALTEKWHLPKEIIETIAHHHCPLLSKDHSYPAALTHVADWLTHGMQLGFNGDKVMPKLDESAWGLIGIPESALADILNEIDRQYSDTVAQLIH